MNYTFIFARSGSKGVPHKNIKNIAGIPLIAHTIQTALSCDEIEKIYVSTDCENIAEIAKNHGAEIPFLRPKSLATDTSAEILSWKHAINHFISKSFLDIDKDVFISLPATAPLRSKIDIENCLNEFKRTSADVALCVTEAQRHPAFNMLKQNEDGFYGLVMEEDNISRRQDAPKIFDITTVCYIAKPKYILETNSLLSGKVAVISVPAERAIDIDTELDFKFAEFLLNEKK